MFPVRARHISCSVMFPVRAHHVSCSVMFPVRARHISCSVMFPVRARHISCSVMFPVRARHISCSVMFPVRACHISCSVMLFAFMLSLTISICWLNVTACIISILYLLVFKDSSTPSPFVEEFPTADECAQRNARPDHIYMDCMGFGMGCSCLQVTFQGCDITEARLLYDQLAVICPIMVRSFCVCVCVCALIIPCIFLICILVGSVCSFSNLQRLSGWHWLSMASHFRFSGWQNWGRKRIEGECRCLSSVVRRIQYGYGQSAAIHNIAYFL